MMVLIRKEIVKPDLPANGNQSLKSGAGIWVVILGFAFF